MATLTSESGSFIVTGSSVNLLKNSVIQVTSGSYTLTGSEVDLFSRHGGVAKIKAINGIPIKGANIWS